MNGERSTTDDFFAIAIRFGLLKGDADELRRESEQAGLAPTEFVVRRGLLDSVGIDIVETLRNPEESIPGYEIEGVLGRGAMGVVYRARQRNLDRVVALKTILVSQMSAPSSLERFELEGRTIGKLRHPNIIAAFDLGRHAGRLFLAMEYIEGTDLDQRIQRQGPLDESTAWHIVRQTAGGLDHAARMGVVHRDVKPANLMLVDPPLGYPIPAGVPMVKIADFGLALLANAEPNARLTTENTTLGSPYYMAPEQFRSSHVDHVADIYALGATVYHALAGRPPFAGLGVAQIIGAKLGGAPELLRSLRPGLSQVTYDLVDQLMATDPDERIRSYATLTSRIDDVIGAQNGSRPFQAVEEQLGGATILESPTATGATGTTAKHGAAATDFVPVEAALRGTGIQEGMTARLRDSAGLALKDDGAPQSSRRRLPWWSWFVVGALLVGGLLAIWRPWSGASISPAPLPLPVKRQPMKPLGMSVYLFNGLNTDGWNRRNGNWISPVAHAVLSGSDGTIGRPLVRRSEDDGKPRVLPWYRVELVLQPMVEDHRGIQEVHFGIEHRPGYNGPRHVLRRTLEGLAVGARSADESPFEPLDSVDLPTIAADAEVGVSIERNPNGWFVRVRGTTLPGLPLGSRELPEFRLRAEEGTAWFSDLVVTELEPTEAE